MTPTDTAVAPVVIACRRCVAAETRADRWRHIAERYATDNARLRDDLATHEAHAIRSGGYKDES